MVDLNRAFYGTMFLRLFEFNDNCLSQKTSRDFTISVSYVLITLFFENVWLLTIQFIQII